MSHTNTPWNIFVKMSDILTDSIESLHIENRQQLPELIDADDIGNIDFGFLDRYRRGAIFVLTADERADDNSHQMVRDYLFSVGIYRYQDGTIDNQKQIMDMTEEMKDIMESNSAADASGGNWYCAKVETVDYQPVFLNIESSIMNLRVMTNV